MVAAQQRGAGTRRSLACRQLPCRCISRRLITVKVADGVADRTFRIRQLQEETARPQHLIPRKCLVGIERVDVFS